MKLLLADDDTDLLDVTGYALRRAGYTVITATDGQAAVERCACERPDLVLLDVGLPGLNGFDACRRIRENAATPVILLSERSDDDSVVQGFLTGADDYVTKPFSHRQLSARINAVLKRVRGGLTPAPAGGLVVGNLRLDVPAREATIRGEGVRLTPMEFKILHALAINEGRVVSSDRLVELAWGYEGGEVALVKTHIAHIRRKLGVGKDGEGAERPDGVRIRTVPWVGYSLTRVGGGWATATSTGPRGARRSAGSLPGTPRDLDRARFLAAGDVPSMRSGLRDRRVAPIREGTTLA